MVTVLLSMLAPFTASIIADACGAVMIAMEHAPLEPSAITGRADQSRLIVFTVWLIVLVPPACNVVGADDCGAVMIAVKLTMLVPGAGTGFG